MLGGLLSTKMQSSMSKPTQILVDARGSRPKPSPRVLSSQNDVDSSLGKQKLGVLSSEMNILLNQPLCREILNIQCSLLSAVSGGGCSFSATVFDKSFPP